jgi:hypothetical protein
VFAENRGKPDPAPGEKPIGRFEALAVRQGDLLVHFPDHYDARSCRMRHTSHMRGAIGQHNVRGRDQSVLEERSRPGSSKAVRKSL